MSAQKKNDYRIFVGAFPQGELAERLQDLRMKYDPVTAQITPPHVTLAGTYWRSGSPTVENEAETIQRLEIIQGILLPFNLLIGGIRTFPGEKPVVYLDLKVNKELIEARNLLLGLLGPDKHSNFIPHLTLAMRLPWNKAWAMVSELQATEWNQQVFTTPIKNLQLMLRSPVDKAWRCIYSLNLEV